MDVEAVLRRFQSGAPFSGCRIVHRELPVQPAVLQQPEQPLSEPVRSALLAQGIEELYSHQARALDLARQGRSVLVVTGTASGKTLCYHLPVLEAALADPEMRALYLYPTKALSRDQLGGLGRLTAAEPQLAQRITADVYDGDTPTARRRTIRGKANVVLSNPDMLHVSLLPQHPKWSRFFAGLRYVVIDEVHTYRGIFGAHVAGVLRRLLRVCRHYDNRPAFIATSATVDNPAQLAEQLLGEPVEVIDENGAPRGPRHVLLWNPAAHGDGIQSRRSAADEATRILAELVQEDCRSITFTRTRVAAELIYKSLRDHLSRYAPRMAQQVSPYRGGYLPDERRRIEQDLFAGRLRAVISTNALELGIDVGSLDAALLVGYPGTIASTWQQMGRAGRRLDASLAVLVASSDPIDQFMVRHPEYFFGQSPEQATLDPQNPYILARQLSCAAFELPIDEEDGERFGPLTLPIAEHLRETGRLTEAGGQFFWARPDSPAVGISLRHMSDNTFSIIEQKPTGDEVIANVDAISAPELVYPEAVYLHAAETFLVRSLDLNGKVAKVERVATDYYTQAILESKVALKSRRKQRPFLDGEAGFGEQDVTWKTVAFKKIKFQTRENIGFGPVDIPAQTLATSGLWLAVGPETRRQLKEAGHRTSEALAGVRNLFIAGLPLLVMCDPRDISGVVDSANLGVPALFVYDRYPGGLGFAEKGYYHLEKLLEICHAMIHDCPCTDGCPGCVGLPNLRPAIHSDPDLTRGYPIPNKGATEHLLAIWTGVCACSS